MYTLIAAAETANIAASATGGFDLWGALTIGTRTLFLAFFVASLLRPAGYVSPLLDVFNQLMDEVKTSVKGKVIFILLMGMQVVWVLVIVWIVDWICTARWKSALAATTEETRKESTEDDS